MGIELCYWVVFSALEKPVPKSVLLVQRVSQRPGNHITTSVAARAPGSGVNNVEGCER